MYHIASEQNTQTVDVHSHFPARWLLSSICLHVKHHLVTSCKIKKHGTLLYRPNTNFGMFLSNVLWHQTSSCYDDRPSDSTVNLLQVNDCIHLYIQDSLSKFSDTPYDHSAMDLENEIKKIPKPLWQTVTYLTMYKNERQGRAKPNRTKRLRQLFIASAIM